MNKPSWMPIAAAVLLVGLLAGCSGPAYRPFKNGVGFSDAMIGQDLFEVTYNGSSSTGASDATYYATLRAAELAAYRGKPFLRIERIEQSAVTETDWMPPEYRTQRIRGRNIDTVYTTATPGYTNTYNVPISRLVVRLLDTGDGSALEARQILLDAQARGVDLSPATVSAMQRLPATAHLPSPTPAPPAQQKPPATTGG